MDDMGTIECKTPSNRGDNILVSATAFDVTKVSVYGINFIVMNIMIVNIVIISMIRVKRLPR